MSKPSRCGRCRSTFYCDANCQRAAYPTHKARCMEIGRERAALAAGGFVLTKSKAVWRWFESLPNVLEQAICLAWQHRHHSPVIQVDGGADGSAEKIVVLCRERWRRGDAARHNGGPSGWAARFANNFDRDLHFFVKVEAVHPACERAPIVSRCFTFPHAPEEMDGLVRQFVEEWRDLGTPHVPTFGHDENCVLHV